MVSCTRLWQGWASGGQQGEPGGEAGDTWAFRPGSRLRPWLCLSPCPLPRALPRPRAWPFPGSGPGLPPQQVADFLASSRQAGFMTWTPALGARQAPSQEYVVQEGCSRRLQLQRILPPADRHPHGPPIWQTLLTITQRPARHRASDGTGRQAPALGNNASSRQPQRSRAGPLHRGGLDAPSAAVAAAQGAGGCCAAAQQCPSSLSGSGPHLSWGTCRTGQRGSRVRRCPEGRHGGWSRTGAWTGASGWRILNGELHVGTFLRPVGTGTGTRAQHVCPHACYSAVPATLTHSFETCPVDRYGGGMGVRHLGRSDRGSS